MRINVYRIVILIGLLVLSGAATGVAWAQSLELEIEVESEVASETYQQFEFTGIGPAGGQWEYGEYELQGYIGQEVLASVEQTEQLNKVYGEDHSEGVSIEVLLYHEGETLSEGCLVTQTPIYTRFGHTWANQCPVVPEEEEVPRLLVLQDDEDEVVRERIEAPATADNDDRQQQAVSEAQEQLQAIRDFRSRIYLMVTAESPGLTDAPTGIYQASATVRLEYF